MNNHFSHIITLSIQQQTFSIFELSGEENLSQPFHFEITLILSINLNLDFTLYMPATLLITDNKNNERSICGIITKIQHLGLFDTEQIHLVVHLQSLLSILNMAKSLQSFQNMTVLDITRKLLQKIGYHNNQLNFYCNKTYASQNYIIQAPNETDLAFLHRLLAYAGIFYWCSSNQNQETICFSDNNQACSHLIQNEVFFVPPSDLNLFDNFELRHGYLYHMQVLSQLVTTTFSLSCFNPDISPEGIEKTQSISANLQNQIVQHISHVATSTTELAQETLLRIQRAKIDNWQLNMHSNIVLLSPGQKLNLNAFHFQKTSGFNNNYLIIKLKHFAHQPSDIYQLGTVTNYHNEITLIEAAIAYCDPLPDLPKIPTCWMGHVESDGYYPLLDENGRYKLQMHYDTSDKPNINSKPTLSRLSNYGSAQQHPSIGNHLPLATGTEIILSCINGNFNNPFIIGTCPNFIFRSPVTSLNKTQNKLLTQQKNLLLLDDKKNYQRIQLATADLQNQIELNNSLDTPAINIKTEQGLINLNAYKNITLQSNNSLMEKCNNNWLHYSQHNYSVQTQNQSIYYQSAKDHQYVAEQNILINPQNNLSINSARDILIECKSNMRIIVDGSSNNHIIAKENITFKCTKTISYIGTGSGKINLSTNGNNICISPDGTISCSGNIIELQTLSGIFFSTPPQAGEGNK